MKIKLSLGQKLPYKEVEVKKGTTIEALYREHREEMKYDSFGAMVGNDLMPLSFALEKSCKVQLRDIRFKPVFLIYQNSLNFLFLKGLYDVMGPKVAAEVVTSVDDGIVWLIDAEYDEDTVAKIAFRMRELVSLDLPIESRTVTEQEFCEILMKQGMEQQSRALRDVGEGHEAALYTLDDFSDYFYTWMVPSTGYLRKFEVLKYRDGILLRTPQPGNPNEIPDFVDNYIMFNAFKEQRHWNDLLGIRYVADINDKIRAKDYKTMVQLSEALHDKKVVDIADEITEKGKRVILILGPSSSGKTTFAKRLSIQLMVNGHRSLYLGTDDYFVERSETPKDEFGEYDFESIEALDVELFNKQMKELLEGKEVDMPVFNFLTGQKEYGHRITRLEEGQPIIIEGIHSFDSRLTKSLPEKDKYYIYISPLTQLNMDAHNRLPTTDLRLVRRMVRDARTRGHDAESTFKLWHKVQAAEVKNIFPYSNKADVFFNTVHVYELSVLKKYVVPLLETVKPESEEYYDAKLLLRFFGLIEDLDDESVLAADSILREFIGGSTYA